MLLARSELRTVTQIIGGSQDGKVSGPILNDEADTGRIKVDEGELAVRLVGWPGLKFGVARVG